MSTQQALALPSAAASNTVVINARCSLRIEADQRVIVVGGLPVHHYRAEDAVAEAYAMVFLVESGFAQQTDVARAFDRSVRTVRRHQARYVQGGMAALGREEGWRRGRRRISGRRLRSIELLKSQGMSNRAVAHRLGVSEKAIRKLVGPSTPAESAQLAFAGMTTAAAGAPPAAGVPSAKSTDDDEDGSAPSVKDGAGDPISAAEDDAEPVPMSLDRDASDRSFDRQLAHLGLLDDAAPLFREGASVPGVGVLLALPCLVESGLFRISGRPQHDDIDALLRDTVMTQRAGDPAGGMVGVPRLVPWADALLQVGDNLAGDAAVNVTDFAHGCSSFSCFLVAAAAATLPRGERGVARRRKKMRDVE